MNPLLSNERENTGGWFSLRGISTVVTVALVVFALAVVRPQAASENGLVIMVSWYLILIAAIALVLWIWKTPQNTGKQRSRTTVLSIAAVVVTTAGVVIAFLSGDKFDALRAGMISMVLLIFSRPGRSAGYRN